MRFCKFLLSAMFVMNFIFQDVWVTAYTASYEECGKTDGITASGLVATPDLTIASDHLPFGTRVEIGEQIYIVQDRLGGSHTNRIDIFMDSIEDAMKFGKQNLIVSVYYEEA